MKTAKVFIETFQKYLGCNELDGSHKKLIDTFNSSKLKSFSLSYDDPWCSGGLSAVAIVCGYTDIIPISGNCDEMYNKGKIMGISVDKILWNPKIGDIIFYDWDLDGELDHVGCVTDIIGSNIKVIECNKSNSVCYRTINYKDVTITSILRPRYDKTDKSVTMEYSYKDYCDTVIKCINGEYGNGTERQEKLEKEGYDYNKIQNIINILLK